jgi:cell division protein FtsB
VPLSRRSRAGRTPTTRGLGRQRVTRDSLRSASSTATGRFTTRAAVLALVLCALVLTAAVPARELLAQRSQISALESGQVAQRERVEALEVQRRQLQDPAHVQRLARERLHFVMPGETAYVVLRPSEAPAAQAQAADGPVRAEGADAPWWSQLYGSVRAADRPGAT